LQFNFNFTNNFTNIHLPNSVIKPRAIPDFTQPFQSEVQSAASALTAALPAAASKVQSGIGAAASKVQSGIGAAASDINTIEARIPRNCSFGTKKFCVGSLYNTTCYNFPFNISDIIPEGIPEDVTSFISDKAQFLKPLEGILSEVIIMTIRGSLYFGLGYLALITALFFYFILKVLSVATLCIRLLICFSTIFFFSIFSIATGILYHLQSKIQELESIFTVKKGDMNSYYTVLFICTGVMMLLTFIMSAFK
jgi:hypothetical protein